MGSADWPFYWHSIVVNKFSGDADAAGAETTLRDKWLGGLVSVMWRGPLLAPSWLSLLLTTAGVYGGACLLQVISQLGEGAADGQG